MENKALFCEDNTDHQEVVKTENDSQLYETCNRYRDIKISRYVLK